MDIYWVVINDYVMAMLFITGILIALLFIKRNYMAFYMD
jgi:hypothetical protein